MKNTNILIGVCLLAVTIGAIIVWGIRDRNESDGVPLGDGMVMYWGDGCPHCENVKKFLEENRVADKVSFEQKEVWNNRANAKEMNRRAEVCGLSSGDIGVPFLFSDGKCFIGEPDVEKEFLRKADAVNEIPADQQAPAENK